MHNKSDPNYRKKKKKKERKKKKNLPVLQETQVWSLDQEDPLEKEMATQFSILAWRIPWTEEPIRLPPMGLKESDMTERLSTVLPSFRIWQKTIGIKGLWIVMLFSGEVTFIKYHWEASNYLSNGLWEECASYSFYCLNLTSVHQCQIGLNSLEYIPLRKPTIN